MVADRGRRFSSLGRILAALLVATLVGCHPQKVPAPVYEPTAAPDTALPRPALLERALAAYRRVEAAGLVRTRMLTVIDYTLRSRERRLWVIDPSRLVVLFHEFVAHGRGSTTDDDPDLAICFGNEPESKRSSLGTFLTGDPYLGEHGLSLELIGLDPGVNDKAFERRIVIHPADYVGAEFRAENDGRVGRSWGCPALDPAVSTAIIYHIKDGSVVYVDGTTAGGASPAEMTTGGGNESAPPVESPSSAAVSRDAPSAVRHAPPPHRPRTDPPQKPAPRRLRSGHARRPAT